MGDKVVHGCANPAKTGRYRPWFKKAQEEHESAVDDAAAAAWAVAVLPAAAFPAGSRHTGRGRGPCSGRTRGPEGRGHPHPSRHEAIVRSGWGQSMGASSTIDLPGCLQGPNKYTPAVIVAVAVVAEAKTS